MTGRSTSHEYRRIDSSGIDNYKFLTASVIPRPIAWVSTFSASGEVNIAPFSFFTVASPEPPTVLFSVGGHGRKISGEEKDTLVNVRRGSPVTISQVERAVLDEMVGTAAEFGAGVSELGAVRLDEDGRFDGYPPMVAGTPGAMFGAPSHIMTVGKSFLVFCEIDSYVFRQDVFDGRHVDYDRVGVVGRLGGPHYAGIAEVIRSPRVDCDDVLTRFGAPRSHDAG